MTLINKEPTSNTTTTTNTTNLYKLSILIIHMVKLKSIKEIICIMPSLINILPRDAMLARYMLSSCVRLSVCLSVCLTQAGIVSKPLNTESRKQRHTIAQGI